MDIQKEISEYAEYLRNCDLEKAERYQSNLEAYEIVDKFIKNEMYKARKNKKMFDSLRHIRSKLDCECGGSYMVADFYQKRLNKNRYEEIARQTIERKYRDQTKEES